MYEIYQNSPMKLCIQALEEDFQEYLAIARDYPIWEGRIFFDHTKYKYCFLLKKLYELDLSGKSVLNVGCGSCVFDYILKKRGFPVTSCDYYENEKIRNFCKTIGVQYFKFNLNSDDTFIQKYDVVICSEVLEHTNINVKNGIKKLLTACHKDTILIITLPNIYSINNLLRIIQGINIVEDFPDEIVMKDDIILDMRCHKRECTKKDLLDAAKGNKINLIETGNCYTSTPFNHPYISKIIPQFIRPHIYGIFRQ